MIFINMKSRILLSVYGIYCLRKLKSPLIAESFVLAVLATILFYFVSISSFLTNMQASEDSYHYFLTAFSNADLLVQLILVSVGVTGLFLVRNITVFPGLRERFV